MPGDLGTRIAALEKRIENLLKYQSKSSRKAHDELMTTIKAQNKVNQKAYGHITKLGKQFLKMQKKRRGRCARQYLWGPCGCADARRAERATP
ncbi:hypothetical protein [uncultured Tateyamaria sp.]|uniref:hypothetical protein n=1 Tax=uncultured Tateyamaria sp. TaxID=455651 RepID=UPI002621C4BE|nr:hypothetical protein [uncultured Tateyamaria sp.]